MCALETLWEMNLILAKDLAHYTTDCLSDFYVCIIDLYDFRRCVFSKRGILFVTFLFKNSKNNKNEFLALHGSKYRYPPSYTSSHKFH